MLRNQLKQRKIPRDWQPGVAPINVRHKLAKLFPIQNPRLGKTIKDYQWVCRQIWPCRWIKIELNPRKLNSYMYPCSIVASPKTKEGPRREGKNKARIEPAGPAMAARPGPSLPAPKTIPH